MSLYLTFWYTLKKDSSFSPKQNDTLSIKKNHENKGEDAYEYDIGQGALAELLTFRSDALQKAINPETFSNLKVIKSKKGSHDPKVLLAIGQELKSQLERNGDSLLSEIGYDVVWHTNKGETKVKDVLNLELSDFIVFCEFGVENGIKKFQHLYV